MSTNTITRSNTVSLINNFNTKMKRLVKNRKATGKPISANDFLEVDSKDIGHLFRAAIRDHGLRVNGRVKSTRPGRKGAYINSYAV